MKMKCKMQEIFNMPIGTKFTDLNGVNDYIIQGNDSMNPQNKQIFNLTTDKPCILSSNNLYSYYVVDSEFARINGEILRVQDYAVRFAIPEKLTPVSNLYDNTELRIDSYTVNFMENYDARIINNILENMHSFYEENYKEPKLLFCGMKEYEEIIKFVNRNSLEEHVCIFPNKLYNLDIHLVPVESFLSFSLDNIKETFIKYKTKK